MEKSYFFNIFKLFRSTENKPVEVIRVSTLASYWYCSVKAWLQAQGVEPEIENEATEIGTKIHNAISKARSLSEWEKEFERHLKQFFIKVDAGKGTTAFNETEGKVLARAWKRNGETVGYIVTHGLDDYEVSPNREVTLIEYKTTNQRYIDNYKLSTALFQLKLYWWILVPLLSQVGYRIVQARLVYLNRKGEILGEKIIRQDESQYYENENYKDDWFVYNTVKVEKDIANIFLAFENPDKLIPPAKFKCFNCSDAYKKRCPFAKTVMS
ncbi:MAG: PD-(D/E)XK nuclease family protein [Candidatus Bathyarchaeota archaeon]|nr:PD-(D/E)XK nuclease family protein [Candidatus Bathyarchaeota archaeon]